MTKKQFVANYINSSDMEDVVTLWKQYVNESNREDDDVWENSDDMLDEIIPSTHEFARSSTYGHYNYSDKFFAFNGYGNIVTFSRLDDDRCPIDVDALADYLIDNGDSDFEIDSQTLEENFLDEYFPNEDDYNKAMEIADNLSVSEPVDFLMDEWDDIAETIKSHWDD